MSLFKCEDANENDHPIPDPENKSFAEFYLEKVEQFPLSCFVDGSTNEKMFFAELASRIRLCSSNLLKKGYKKGDTICIMSKNCHNFVVSLVGCSLAHVTISPANPAYTGKELLYQLEVSQSNSIIIGRELIGALGDALKIAQDEHKPFAMKDIFVIGIDSEVPSAIAGVEVKPFEILFENDNGPLLSPETTIDPKSDIWLLPFSSGTTGLPKGVALTHYNMVANIWQFAVHNPMFGLNPGNTILAVLPMYHIYGLYVFALAAPMRGANVVLLPEFNPVTFLTSIQKYRASHVYIVPPLALFLIKDPRVKEYDLTSIRDLVSAAAPLAGDVALQTYESLTSQGVKDICVRQAYGMTELSPVATAVRYKVGDLDSFSCIGDPIMSTELKIVDLNTKEIVALGEEGELCVRGPQVMKGYFNNEEATRNTIDEDGWLMTGDIAKTNERNQIMITDRLKELIKTKGFQVAPAELEGILLTHPSVQDCCVFGLPHSSLGEAPSAAVVLRPGTPHATVTDTQLSSFVASRVAPYKQLAGGIRFIDLIPKTASGKILRRVLRAKYV